MTVFWPSIHLSLFPNNGCTISSHIWNIYKWTNIIWWQWMCPTWLNKWTFFMCIRFIDNVLVRIQRPHKIMNYDKWLNVHKHMYCMKKNSGCCTWGHFLHIHLGLFISWWNYYMSFSHLLQSTSAYYTYI